MKEFFNKVCAFFKKCWYVFFIPVGAFILAIVFKKDDKDEINHEIKEEKKEIKEETKVVEEQIEVVEKVEEVVEDKVEEVKEVIQENLVKKEERDKKAKEFFPGL